MSIPAQWIDDHAATSPDHLALLFEGRSWNYAQLAEDAGKVAAMLVKLGIRNGDRIAYLGFNSPEQLLLLLAASRLGVAVSPLNWRLAPPEHAFMLADAGVRALFCDPAFADAIEACPDRRDVLIRGSRPGFLEWHSLIAAAGPVPPITGAPTDLFLIVYTSGTTGRPKGAALTQDAIVWNARNSLAGHDMTSADRILTVLPLFHVGAINIQTLPAFLAGATVILQPKVDPSRILKAITADRPSLTVLVPAVMAGLIDHVDWPKTDLSALRVITTGSSIVPVTLIEAFHDRGTPVIQVYGSTETAPIATIQSAAAAVATIGTVGPAAAYCALKVVDDDGREVSDGVAGELLIRGPNLLACYWNNPAATEEALRNGWFHSGDIGYRRPDGCYVVIDRKKDLVISGGENIYPAEIEAVLLQHPAIKEAAVVGKADPRWGETPVVFVVVQPGAMFTQSDVLAALEGRLARFKWPRACHLVDELPRNAMGKVQKAQLRDRLKDQPIQDQGI
jgi:fatty-acyl-CoA synthase